MGEAVDGEGKVSKGVDCSNDGEPEEWTMEYRDRLEGMAHRVEIVGDAIFQ